MGRAPTTTTPRPADNPPERLETRRSDRRSTTPDDTQAPAERVRVTDVPAQGRRRAYLVEREPEQDGNDALQALLADYLAVVDDRQAIPMATSALQSVLERFANDPPRMSS